MYFIFALLSITFNGQLCSCQSQCMCVPLGTCFSEYRIAKWNLFSLQLHRTIKKRPLCSNLFGFSQVKPWLNSPPGEVCSFQGRSYWHLAHCRIIYFILFSFRRELFQLPESNQEFIRSDILFLCISILSFCIILDSWPNLKMSWQMQGGIIVIDKTIAWS